MTGNFEISLHSLSSIASGWTATAKKRFWDSLLGKLQTKEVRSRLGANGWLTLEVSQEVQKLEVILDMALTRRQKAR